MTTKIRNAPPKASAMLEALRGLGYSTADALADIVDNSISAGASEVRIDFRWEGGEGAFVSILDDGWGMDDPELESAMRLGEKSPLDERSGDDLGRFGMGLKTASFSQCRSLTVASKREGSAVCCLRWDLDEIAARDDGAWALIEGAAEGSEERLALLNGNRSGSLMSAARSGRGGKRRTPGSVRFFGMVSMRSWCWTFLGHTGLLPGQTGLTLLSWPSLSGR